MLHTFGRSKRIGVALGSLALATTFFSATSSTAAPRDDIEEPSYLIATELPDGVINSDPPSQYRTDGNPPAEITEGLLRLSLDRPDLRTAGAEWLPEVGKVALYSAADESTVLSALAEAGLSSTVEYRPAVLDAVGKADIGRQIAGPDGSLPSGHRVVSVSPSLDGSSVKVILDETVALRGMVELPEPEVSDGGEKIDVEIDVEFGPPAEAALRNHAANPSTYSGAVMHRLGTSAACTTGFRMTEIPGSVPVMGSAHHCHAGVEGEGWGYTTIPGYPEGNAYSAYGPGLSSGDVSVWEGPLADQMLPGIFVGDHTVAGSGVYSIKGAIHSVVNAQVCYSGSFSGTMCSNKIVETGMTVCYGAPYPCYNNIVMTEQITGKPAAGNGDSGGPVYSTSNGIYATGIISGIVNGTDTCVGEPGGGGRKCSSVALYAPIAELMANGYGLNYIP